MIRLCTVPQDSGLISHTVSLQLQIVQGVGSRHRQAAAVQSRQRVCRKWTPVELAVGSPTSEHVWPRTSSNTSVSTSITFLLLIGVITAGLCAEDLSARQTGIVF